MDDVDAPGRTGWNVTVVGPFAGDPSTPSEVPTTSTVPGVPDQWATRRRPLHIGIRAVRMVQGAADQSARCGRADSPAPDEDAPRTALPA